MNPDRLFDDQLDRWLDDGPTDAPDRLLALLARRAAGDDRPRQRLA